MSGTEIPRDPAGRVLRPKPSQLLADVMEALGPDHITTRTLMAALIERDGVEPRAVTPAFGWHLPVLADPPNVPYDLTELALDIEATLSGHRHTLYTVTAQSIPVGTSSVAITGGTATGPDAAAWAGGVFTFPLAGVWQVSLSLIRVGAPSANAEVVAKWVAGAHTRATGGRIVTTTPGGGALCSEAVRVTAGQQILSYTWHSHSSPISLSAYIATNYIGP